MDTDTLTIEWVRGDRCDTGYVGRIRAFTVGYHSKGGWYVECNLPGIKRSMIEPGEAEAKARAASMWRTFLAQLARPRATEGEKK